MSPQGQSQTGPTSWEKTAGGGKAGDSESMSGGTLGWSSEAGHCAGMDWCRELQYWELRVLNGIGGMELHWNGEG